jgi:hypothetical protein
MKYYPDEVRKLKEYKELNSNVKTSFSGSFAENNENDNSVVFDFSSDSDSNDEIETKKKSKNTIEYLREDSSEESDLDIDNL